MSTTFVIDWQETLLKTDLPANAKYIGMYLRTFMNAKSDIAWPSISRIQHETGLSRSTVCKYLQVLEHSGWVARERGSKGVNTRYHACLPKGIEKELGSPCDALGSTRDGLSSPCGGLEVVRETDPNNQANNQVINNNGANANRFRSPTVDEVRDYCQEKGYTLDPERFVNFYESKGWMVGKTKMKKWKAAVANWDKSNGNAKGHTGQHTDTRGLSAGDRVRAAAAQRQTQPGGQIITPVGGDG